MKKGFTALLLLLAGMLAYGLQVDRDELNKGQGSNIIFTNYVGPHSKIDTLDEIFGIGRSLGRNVADKTAEFTYAGKYRLIHAIGPAEGVKLDADIFVIEAGAEVDDVINIMRAVGGYLQAAYAYSQPDAMVLARFVVYYNAVFRGDMKYLGSVYKGLVMGYLSPDNAGIGTKYTDWPGKTRMVIPLSSGAQKGNLSAVGAGQLAAPKVIENLQSQPGKALPERKDLTELQQKGIEQGQQQVAGQQEKIQQEKQQLQAQTQALEQSKQAAAQAQAAASAPGATSEQKQAAATAQAEVQKQEQAVAGQQQKIQQQEQAAAAQQQQLDASQQAVQQQRAKIAADEQALIQQKQQEAAAQPAAPVQPAAPGQVLFIYAVAESPEHFGKLVLIDRVSGKLLTQSDLNSVRGRLYVTAGGSLVVAAGRPDRNGAVRLVTLDPTTLAVRQEGKDNLVPTTYLAASDPSVYAVIDSGQGAYLGRFDATAALQAQSERKVDASTYIVVSGTEVYVQDDSGNILILNKDDLKEKKRTG
jgi:pyruvate/2-oxoglutarate dehydrogenase complex dihydrolipoamide acyltransferase (E2) component